jgi:hypothetical protein
MDGHYIYANVPCVLIYCILYQDVVSYFRPHNAFNQLPHFVLSVFVFCAIGVRLTISSNRSGTYSDYVIALYLSSIFNFSGARHPIVFLSIN